jgi:hypothetical protein
MKRIVLTTHILKINTMRRVLAFGLFPKMLLPMSIIPPACNVTLGFVVMLKKRYETSLRIAVFSRCSSVFDGLNEDRSVIK